MPLVEHVSDNVVFVQGNNNGTFPYCNSYIIKHREELTVIDPRCGRQNLKKGLALLNRSLTDITAVLNTHFHVDHSTPSRWLSSEFGIPIYMHKSDATAVASWDAMAARYAIETSELKGMLQRVFEGQAGFQPFRVTNPFHTDDILPAGIKSIRCPGHTPGHCGFVYKGLLFSGDVELCFPWVGNINSSVNDFLETTKKLSEMEFAAILPGHGLPEFNHPKNSLKRYHGKILKSADNVYRALSEVPGTLDQIMQPTRKFLSASVRGQFSGENGHLLYHFERIAVLQYLKYLESTGRAKKITAANGEPLWVKC